MKLTKYEQETIINYNQEEKTASCFTHDLALIRKLDEFVRNGEAITVVQEGDGWKELSSPRNVLKFVSPVNYRTNNGKKWQSA